MALEVTGQKPVKTARKPCAMAAGPRKKHPNCPADRAVLSTAAAALAKLGANLKRKADAAKTPGEAMDAFDTAHERGLKDAATHAIKRAIDLCQNQREGLQVAKTADFLGYKEAADYAYKIVEGLPSSEEFPF